MDFNEKENKISGNKYERFTRTRSCGSKHLIKIEMVKSLNANATHTHTERLANRNLFGEIFRCPLSSLLTTINGRWSTHTHMCQGEWGRYRKVERAKNKGEVCPPHSNIHIRWSNGTAEPTNRNQFFSSSLLCFLHIRGCFCRWWRVMSTYNTYQSIHVSVYRQHITTLWTHKIN